MLGTIDHFVLKMAGLIFFLSNYKNGDEVVVGTFPRM